MAARRFPDPVVAAYQRDVDRTLLRENLRLTPAQRVEKMLSALRMVAQLRVATVRKRPAVSR